MSSTKNYIQVQTVIGTHSLYSPQTESLYQRTRHIEYANDTAAYNALVAGTEYNGAVYTVTGATETLKVLYGPVVGLPIPDNVIDT